MTDLNPTHTPLPWTIDKYGAVLRDGQTIVTEGFALSGSALAKQNTAFIVHAVNSHHDLIEALRALTKEFRTRCRSFDNKVLANAEAILTKAEAGR